MKDQLTQILSEKGTIVEDFENVNGRFVTVLVEDAPHKAAWELSKELALAFPRGHVSKPSGWQGEYNVQVNSKRPAFLHPGCIYPAGSFGDKTEITIQGGR